MLAEMQQVKWAVFAKNQSAEGKVQSASGPWFHVKLRA